MICLGYKDAEKTAVINSYCQKHDIEKVFVFTPARFSIVCDHPTHEIIDWTSIILYKYYYRLLQEIAAQTLLVVNQPLRTQNRNDLAYNCLRNFLNQTAHKIIFSHLPLIDTLEDFMILFDFDTRSRWKRHEFTTDLLRETVVNMHRVDVTFKQTKITTKDELRERYATKKAQLISSIGTRDPHTIPRNLYLLGGKAKLEAVSNGYSYVGRNNRFKTDRLRTYREDSYHEAPYIVFEYPHKFLDFADFIALSRQEQFQVMTADLKVDRWYLERYRRWSDRIRDAYDQIS